MTAVDLSLVRSSLRAVLIWVMFTSSSLRTVWVCGSSTPGATTVWSITSSLDTAETATATEIDATTFISATSDFSVGDTNATNNQLVTATTAAENNSTDISSTTDFSIGDASATDIATTATMNEDNSTDISNTTDDTTAISDNTFEDLNFTTIDVNASKVSTSELVTTTTTTSAPLPTGPTTTRGTTTTTISPLEYIRCGAGNFVPVGLNVNMHIISRGVVQYTCMDGFRENGTGSSEIRCSSGWNPKTALVCVPIEQTYPRTTTVKSVDLYPGVPDWIPVLVITVLVIVVLAWIVLLALLIYVCRRRQRARSFTFNQPAQKQQQQQEENTSHTSQSDLAQGREASSGWRCWPRKRTPTKPLRGYLGLDGVGLTIMRDNYLLPVKKRF